MSGMVDVLVDHQRQNAGSCLCGWSKLGYSHPEHQAEMLANAGFGDMAQAWDEGFESAGDSDLRRNLYRTLKPLE